MGVTLYELIAGHSPFLNVDPSTMYKNILNAQYNCPLGFSGNLINLLRNMLRVDVTRRYGNLVNGFQDIKKHRWFHATDWCALFNKQITPPFVPTIFDAQDIGNFKNQRSDKTFLQSTSETNLYDEEFKDF
jgi:protein kinase A